MRGNKEGSKEQIQKLKSVISENTSILDNKCSEDVEILRVKYVLGGELKRVCEENYISVTLANNLNRKYENV